MGSEVSLRDMCDVGALFLTDGYRTRRDQLSADGAPILRVAHVREGFIEVDKTDRISHDYARRFAQKTSQADDVVITTKGTVGRAARISERFAGYVYSPQVCVLRVLDREVLDPAWLYCWVRSPQFQDQLDLHSGQTDMAPYVKLKDLLGFGIAPPPSEEQRAIAEVLGALDDRITYLGERVRLAHATILSWYDSLGTSSFPSAPLGSVINVVGGSTPSTKQPLYWDGEHCWVTPKDLSEQQSPVVLHSSRKLTDGGVNKISSGLLPEGTVLMSSRAPIGYVAVARVPLAVNQGFIALPPSEVACPAYLVGWLHRSMEEIKARAGGSTFAEISKRNFKPIAFPVPRGHAYEEFRHGADELYDLIADAELERHTTVELRDALLPQLLSGELRVEDPARLLGAVA